MATALLHCFPATARQHIVVGAAEEQTHSPQGCERRAISKKKNDHDPTVPSPHGTILRIQSSTRGYLGGTQGTNRSPPPSSCSLCWENRGTRAVIRAQGDCVVWGHIRTPFLIGRSRAGCESWASRGVVSSPLRPALLWVFPRPLY